MTLYKNRHYRPLLSLTYLITNRVAINFDWSTTIDGKGKLSSVVLIKIVFYYIEKTDHFISEIMGASSSV